MKNSRQIKSLWIILLCISLIFAVTGCNQSVSEQNSSIADAEEKVEEPIETIDAPVITGYDPVDDGLRVNWDSVENADGYEYYFAFISSDSDADEEHEVKTTQETSAEYNFQNNNKLRFEVRAYRINDQGKLYSDWTTSIIDSDEVKNSEGIENKKNNDKTKSNTRKKIQYEEGLAADGPGDDEYEDGYGNIAPGEGVNADGLGDNEYEDGYGNIAPGEGVYADGE